MEKEASQLKPEKTPQEFQSTITQRKFRLLTVPLAEMTW